MGIEIRRGPKGSHDEGGYEDGHRLTIVGRKLTAGEEMPDMLLWKPDRYNTIPSVERATMPQNYLLYSVNGFLTPVCETEARQCKNMVEDSKWPNGVPLYGLTSENLFVIREWAASNDISFSEKSAHRIVSTYNSDAGIKLGLYIPEYDGALQRALFGVVNNRVAYAEYVYDQGGPLPNFKAAIESVKAGLK